MKLRMGVKCLSCGIDVANGSVRCTNCELKFCVTCTFRLSTDEEPFVCIICKGGDDFFEERSKKAQLICRVTDEALVLASTNGARVHLQELIISLCQTVDLLTRLCMHSELNLMCSLLLRCKEFLSQTQQTVEFDAQPNDVDELVKLVAQQNAQADWVKQSRGPPKSRFPKAAQGEKPTAAAQRSKLAWSEKPTLAVLLHHDNVRGEHPTLQLLNWTLLQLLKRADLKVHILATTWPLDTSVIVEELHNAFSAANCWHQLIECDSKTGMEPTTITHSQRTRLRKRIQDLKITCLLDCIGDSSDGAELWRGLCRPGIEAHYIYDYLTTSLPRDSLFFNGYLLDPWLFEAVRVRDNSNNLNFCCISCYYQPVVTCMENIRRSERKPFVRDTGQTFRIHTPADLTRISPQCLEVLLELLMELPDAVVCYDGSRMTQISATRRNMEAFALRNNLEKDFFEHRVEWWGHLPTDAHGQRIRDQVHVCLAIGPASCHVGANLALCAGTAVVTMQGLCGGGNIASWVATGMLTMLGLGALAVPYGGRAGELVKQFYNNGDMLMLVQSVLDHHARESTSFFNKQRTSNDLTELVKALHVSDSGVIQHTRNFISCSAESPYFFVGKDGVLQTTHRALLRKADDDLGSSFHGSESMSQPWQDLREIMQYDERGANVLADEQFMELDLELECLSAQPHDRGDGCVFIDLTTDAKAAAPPGARPSAGD